MQCVILTNNETVLASQKHWVSGICLSSRIVRTRKNSILELIGFHPQVRGGRHLLCCVPEEELTSATGQPMSY
jgi:hypothetical protein